VAKGVFKKTRKMYPWEMAKEREKEAKRKRVLKKKKKDT
jgi:hypothetical protein